MKIQLFLILALVSMSSFSEYAKGSETVISSLPFTISTSGTYILSGNLTYAGPNVGISVEASNVIIDLKGFTISTSNTTNTNSFGIFVTDSTEDFAIQNGEITGFNIGLQLGGVLNAARNLKVLECKYGIYLTAGHLGFCEIQNCLIDGHGAPSGGAGVTLIDGQNLVQHCQILDYDIGAETENGINIFIANSIFNCTTGLSMLKSDKYQGNVTNGCTTPFSGGTAVGDENN
jgi:hypothetical protein